MLTRCLCVTVPHITVQWKHDLSFSILSFPKVAISGELKNCILTLSSHKNQFWKKKSESNCSQSNHSFHKALPQHYYCTPLAPWTWRTAGLFQSSENFKPLFRFTRTCASPWFYWRIHHYHSLADQNILGTEGCTSQLLIWIFLSSGCGVPYSSQSSTRSKGPVKMRRKATGDNEDWTWAPAWVVLVWSGEVAVSVVALVDGGGGHLKEQNEWRMTRRTRYTYAASTLLLLSIKDSFFLIFQVN